jgi:UDP-N-acetylmuramoyl-L-alanyl-D-glutamate--2,6-diaminopimelate ligase/murE/murF fusion protein
MAEPVTIKQIASITNAKLTGDESSLVTDVSHDSRRAGEGTLFTAVAGALFDAHKFVPQVMA